MLSRALCLLLLCRSDVLGRSGSLVPGLLVVVLSGVAVRAKRRFCCPCLRLVGRRVLGYSGLAVPAPFRMLWMVLLLPLLRVLQGLAVWGLAWLGWVWVSFVFVLPPVVVLALAVLPCLRSVVP